MAMVQYKEYVNSHPDPILAVSDETVQNAVYDWFKYRYIGFEDQDKFGDILKRNVAINYPIYQQKLRIEPGVSQYDWLVEAYRERQLKTKGTTGNTRTQGNDVVNTDTTVTHDSATTYGSTDTNIKTGSQDSVRSGNDTHVKTGGHTETDVDGLHTQTVSPHVQKVTSTDTDHNAWSGDSQVQSNLPMSKSYDTGSIIEPTGDADKKEYYEKAYQHMPALDWSTLSTQGQSGHREYGDDNNIVTESYKYGDGVKGDVTTNQGSKDNPDTRNVEYNSETDTNTYNDVTDKTTYNSITDARTRGGTDRVNGADATTGAVTTTHGEITDNGTDERTDQEQVTGRNEAPADILLRATVFIEQSSAFKWFKAQVEPCFAPYYDEEGGLI